MLWLALSLSQSFFVFQSFNWFVLTFFHNSFHAKDYLFKDWMAEQTSKTIKPNRRLEASEKERKVSNTIDTSVCVGVHDVGYVISNILLTAHYISYSWSISSIQYFSVFDESKKKMGLNTESISNIVRNINRNKFK